MVAAKLYVPDIASFLQGPMFCLTVIFISRESYNAANIQSDML